MSTLSLGLAELSFLADQVAPGFQWPPPGYERLMLELPGGANNRYYEAVTATPAMRLNIIRPWMVASSEWRSIIDERGGMIEANERAELLRNVTEQTVDFSLPELWYLDFIICHCSLGGTFLADGKPITDFARKVWAAIIAEHDTKPTQDMPARKAPRKDVLAEADELLGRLSQEPKQNDLPPPWWQADPDEEYYGAA